MNNKSKKIILSVSLATLATSIIISSVVITIDKNKLYTTNQLAQNKYYYDTFWFKNQNDLFNHALENATITSNNVENIVDWSIEENGQLIHFSSPKELNDFLDSKIQKEIISYSKPYEKTENNEILTSEYNKLSKVNSEQVTIYRGKNNTIHKTIESAKNSYLEIHDAYLFHNVYFKTKEELSTFLENESFWLNSNLSLNSIVLKSPNGQKSKPIDLQKVRNNDNETMSYIEKFIKQNATKYFSLIVENESSSETVYCDKEDIPNFIDKFDASYARVMSNGNSGNYLIDTSIDDEATLFGPYYAKSGPEIKNMKDTSNWKEVKGKDQKYVDNQANIEVFNQFMNSVLIDSDDFKQQEDNLIFYIPSIQTEINTYFAELKYKLPKVYDSVYNLFTTMKKGKRYGQFLKTPILFNHTLDQIIYYNGSQELIDKTRKIYSKICEHFDQLLYSVIPHNLLLNEKKEKFSFLELFKINFQNLDLNYDVEKLMDIVRDQYPELFKSAKLIIGLLSFKTRIVKVPDENIDYQFIRDVFGLDLNKKFYNDYNSIWKLIFTSSVNEFSLNLQKILVDNNVNCVPKFYVQNFVSNYILEKTFEKIILFNFNESEAIKKYNLSETQIKLIKSFFVAKDETVYCTTSSPACASGYIPDYAEYNRNNSNNQYINNIYKFNKENFDPILFFYIRLLEKTDSYYLKDILGNAQHINEGYANNIKNVFKEKIMKNFNNLKNSYSNYLTMNLSSIILQAKILVPELFENKQILLRTLTTFSNETSEILKNVFSYLQYINDQTIQMVDAIKTTLETIKDVTKVLKQVTNKVLKLCKEVSKAFPITIAISIAIDVLMNLYQKDYYSYVYESKDVKYIWNGGSKVSWFYGMIPGDSVGIESMKLLQPMQVIRPNNIDGYYFNGYVFDNMDKLKRAQLNDILFDRYVTEKIHPVYSMAAPKNNRIPNYVDQDVNNLVNSITNAIKTFANNPNGPKPSFIIENDYSFANGYTYDNNLNKKQNIKRIVDSIKPIKIAILPNLITDNTRQLFQPIYRDDMLDDGSVPEYVLPDVSWTPQNLYSINKTNNNYIILDPNTNSNLARMSDIQLENQIKARFYNSFDVQQKQVIKNDLNYIDNFSGLTMNINSKEIYIVQGIYGNLKVFDDYNSARSWLLQEYNFKTYSQIKNIVRYYYKDQVFSSKQEYLEWVSQKAEVIHEK